MFNKWVQDPLKLSFGKKINRLETVSKFLNYANISTFSNRKILHILSWRTKSHSDGNISKHLGQSTFTVAHKTATSTKQLFIIHC